MIAVIQQPTIFAQTWCPGSQCDPCPKAAPPVVSAPHLRQAYFRYPGIALWNQADYWAMLQAFESSAGSWTETGIYSTGRIIISATAKYHVADLSAFNTEWDLQIAYIGVPASIPVGTVWSVSGGYSYIDFQFANAQYLAVLKTDTVTLQ
jgi:hypothetical protein